MWPKVECESISRFTTSVKCFILWYIRLFICFFFRFFIWKHICNTKTQFICHNIHYEEQFTHTLYCCHNILSLNISFRTKSYLFNQNLQYNKVSKFNTQVNDFPFLFFSENNRLLLFKQYAFAPTSNEPLWEILTPLLYFFLRIPWTYITGTRSKQYQKTSRCKWDYL